MPKPLKKQKEIKAWMIVNKKFEEQIEHYPNLFSADIFFTEQKAENKLKDIKSVLGNCVSCGHARKKKGKLQIKILPITLKL